MSIPPAVYDTLIAPVTGWIAATATSLLDKAAAIGQWATEHPVVTIAIPAGYGLVLVALGRLENSRRRS
jgi:hypothetical protein